MFLAASSCPDGALFSLRDQISRGQNIADLADFLFDAALFFVIIPLIVIINHRRIVIPEKARAMSIEKTDALVLKTVDFMESSLVVTLYTREFGKVRGLAKGARRLKNPFETSLDLLASIKLTFIKKNSGALDLLTEAKLARRFRPNRRNLRGLYAGYYVAELLDHMTEDYDPDPDLWRYADLTLGAFATLPRVGSRVFAFEAYLLNAAGEFPSTRYCVECGEELPLDQMDNLARRVVFDVDDGGVVCTRCRAKKRYYGLVPTTIGALKALEASLAAAEDLLLFHNSFDEQLAGQYSRAQNVPVTTLDKIEAQANVVREALDRETLAKLEALDPDSRAALRELMNQYFMRITRRRPRMLDYLGFATCGEPMPNVNDPSKIDSSALDALPAPTRKPRRVLERV